MSENVGRPSKYKSEYCEKLILHMAAGYSFESFAAIIKVNRDTLYEWDKVHEEFSEAKKIAYTENLLFWEKQGIDGLFVTTEFDEKTGRPKSTKSLNSTVWIYNMRNRHLWKDRQIEQDADGSKTKITIDIEDADL